MMFFYYPFSRCCQRLSWPVLLLYFTPSVIRFDVILSLMVVCCRCYIYQQIWNFASVLVFESISVRYKHCEIFRKISNVWLLLINIYAFFLLKLRMVTQLEMKKLLFVERWKIIPVYFICSEQIYRYVFSSIVSRWILNFLSTPKLFLQMGRNVIVTVLNLPSNLYKILLSWKWNCSIRLFKNWQS